MTTRQTRFGKHEMLVEAMTNFKISWPLISISEISEDFWYMSIAYSLQVATCSISNLQSITPKLPLGSQLILPSSSMRSQPNQRLSGITYYARYRGPTCKGCLDFCKTNGYHFSYFEGLINIWHAQLIQQV
ncbi:hypothetical protein X798_01588 [Onchocerca flexuosa]|uniref:Uncharacterized protein n=1 Tax=Onchocerca flexuosa TaxID=387005 RepID=A0A238C154_9BILA|nr:hypothetical protein X798_01588 [Onchocerca flexuosa]